MTSAAQTIIRAVLFDMDGTLVDSETQTDEALAWTMRAHGYEDAWLPPQETRGRSWPDIVETLMIRYPVTVAAAQLQAELIARWDATTDRVQPIPGAAAAVVAAARTSSVAVVSSSPHSTITRIVEYLDVASSVPDRFRVGADEIDRPKPDPQGFLLAAQRMGVAPEECLVFEDSRAGLVAARAANMHSVAVLYCCAEPELCRSLATFACDHYDALPPTFWQQLRTRGAGVFED